MPFWLVLKPLAIIAGAAVILSAIDTQARRLIANVSGNKSKLMLLMLVGWAGFIVGICAVVFLFLIGMPETTGKAVMWVLAIPTTAILTFYSILIDKYAGDQLTKLVEHAD